MRGRIASILHRASQTVLSRTLIAEVDLMGHVASELDGNLWGIAASKGPRQLEPSPPASPVSSGQA